MELIKEQLETYLLHCLDDVVESEVKEAMLYSLLGNGKRVRPLLLLTSLSDYGLDVTSALPIAAAIEMIHTYSLIHDDLPAMDNDDLRRGRATCHIKFDEATAILAGDALLTQAFYLVSQSAYSDSTKLQIITELALASGPCGMILGQCYDMKQQVAGKQIQDVLQIDALKTGKLIAVPLRISGLLAQQEKDLVILEELGMELGIMFQIQDDILDVTSSSEVLGKQTSRDIALDKLTYVKVLGLKKAKEETHRRYQLVQHAVEALHGPTGKLQAFIELLLHRVK